MRKVRTALPIGAQLSASIRRHVTAHALPVLAIGSISAVGALAAFAFQVITVRALGPAAFGLLAAFLAILNVAAIASSALQNAVAVRTAEGLALGDRPPARRRRPSEATVIGLGGAAIVAALTPVLVDALHTSTSVVLLAAAAIPLSFWLSDSVGALQGAGRAFGAVGWTTASLLARVALVLVALALGLGIAGVLASVLAATAVSTIAAAAAARRIPRPARAVFSAAGITVLALSLTFAWLINADVIIVRAGADGVLAGNYASAAVLVKASFMLPATLSIYLLPRFVRSRGDVALARAGERITVGFTVAAGALLALVLGLFGTQVAQLIYGAGYEGAGRLLWPLALAYLPWTTAQSVLIRLTAEASQASVVVVVVAGVLQIAGFLLTLPDVAALLWVQGVLGLAVLAAFLVLSRRLDRTSSPLHEGT